MSRQGLGEICSPSSGWHFCQKVPNLDLDMKRVGAAHWRYTGSDIMGLRAFKKDTWTRGPQKCYRCYVQGVL